MDLRWLGGKRNIEEEKKNNVFVIADPAESEDKVERSDNRIYFYSEVSRPKVLQLNKEIRNLWRTLR